MDKLKISTSVGVVEYEGVPVSNDFDYIKFAKDNGFNYVITDCPENTDKYGGIGIVSFKNHSSSSEIPYHLKKRLEVVFINGLPVIYSIK